MTEDLKSLDTELLLQSVIDTVTDGLTVIDRDFRVIYHNEAIRKMFGEIRGRHCYEAYRSRDEPCSYCTIGDVMHDGKPRRTLVDTKRADGSVAWMECSSGALRDDDGEIVGAVEIVRNVTEQIRLSEECATLRREVRRQVDFENIVTQSKALKEVLRIVARVARTTSPVLITGASGTGKELLAKAIWQNSDRRDAPFVPVNCAALPDSLLESELFGHDKGAFTGATSAKPGLVESADRGTLFLDEVGELPMPLQPKLLRFLQEGEFRRIGETQTRKVDVRVVAATNRDIEEAIKEGVFREDLFYRLSVIPLAIPPLRHRAEDIPMLATHFLQKLCDQHCRKVTGIAADALRTLLDYAWPGNARELENVIEYALHLTEDGATIGTNELPPQIVQRARDPDLGEFLRAGALVSIDEYTRQAITTLQDDHREDEIAEQLGISRKTLWEKRKRWKLPRSRS